MKKTSKIKVAQIITGICLLAAGALLYHVLSNIFPELVFGENSVQGTRLEFNVDNPAGTGFNRDVTVYTENGITSVAFTGKITVEGTADIIVTANEDGSTVYSESYQDLKSKALNFEVINLSPYAYYTISFYSDNAKKGHLILVTNESLVERPERPAHPDHTTPN